MTRHPGGAPSPSATQELTRPAASRLWRTAMVSAVIGALLGVALIVTFWTVTGSARRQQLEVRTVQLTRLTVDDAMALLTPYITTEGGALFRAGSGVPAITIREERERMDDLVRILGEYDHAPAAVTLSLKALADNGGAGLAAELQPLADILTPLAGRGGLRVAASGLVSGTEGRSTTTQLGSGSGALIVTIDIVSAQALDTTVAVRLRVSATRLDEASPLLRTDITVPLGRSVLLGTVATGAAGPRALVVLTPAEIDY